MPCPARGVSRRGDGAAEHQRGGPHARLSVKTIRSAGGVAGAKGKQAVLHNSLWIQALDSVFAPSRFTEGARASAATHKPDARQLACA
ncbi:MAG: hypothetical protein RLZZ124_435 [Cyanobacteriota bacterium]|jgi:hypothetical protein